MQEYDVIGRINELCDARSWTYYRLAKESGIPYSTLSTMLHKANTPSVPTIMKLCNGFGISLFQFFCPEDELALMTAEQRAHMRDWDSLLPENKQAVGKYITFLLSEQETNGIEKR